jgi:hypothetical protein
MPQIDAPEGRAGRALEARYRVENFSTDRDGRRQPHMVQGAAGSFDTL